MRSKFLEKLSHLYYAMCWVNEAKIYVYVSARVMRMTVCYGRFIICMVVLVIPFFLGG